VKTDPPATAQGPTGRRRPVGARTPGTPCGPGRLPHRLEAAPGPAGCCAHGRGRSPRRGDGLGCLGRPSPGWATAPSRGAQRCGPATTAGRRRPGRRSGRWAGPPHLWHREL